MAIETTWTADHLAALEAAYARGVVKVDFPDGSAVQYASMTDVWSAINRLRSVLTLATTGRPARSRITRVTTSKGF